MVAVSLDRFWDLVERHRLLWSPRRPLIDTIGAEAVQLLVRAAWLERRPLQPWDSYPCPSPGGAGCPRRVVAEGQQLVAVCGSPEPECPDLEIAPEDACQLGLSARGWPRALGLLLSVEGAPGSRGAAGFLRLGRRRFGREAVVLYFRWSGGQGFTLGLEQACRREGRDRIALVVVRRRALGVDALDTLARHQVPVIALDEIVRTDSRGLWADLSELVLAERFAGVEPGPALWPRYWLVLDPARARYWYGGVELPLRRRLRTAALLLALAGQPGEVITREELCRAMWADSYGGPDTTESSWDRRIREHKKALVDVVRGAGPFPAEVPAELVQAWSHGSDVVGGYRLAMPPERVVWWSEPGEAV